MKAREPRRTVLIAARMKCGPDRHDVRIHNLSSRGMLIEADEAPARGTYVDVRRLQQVMVGRVMWRNGRHFGVRTQDSMNVDALIRDTRNGAAQSGSGGNDRRAASRPDPGISAARRIERNRWLASSFQFAAIAAGAMVAAGLIAVKVYEILSAPLHAVQRGLSLPN